MELIAAIIVATASLRSIRRTDADFDLVSAAWTLGTAPEPTTQRALNRHDITCGPASGASAGSSCPRSALEGVNVRRLFGSSPLDDESPGNNLVATRQGRHLGCGCHSTDQAYVVLSLGGGHPGGRAGLFCCSLAEGISTPFVETVGIGRPDRPIVGQPPSPVRLRIPSWTTRLLAGLWTKSAPDSTFPSALVGICISPLTVR